MTISSQQGRQAYAGNGVTTVFPVPFKFFQNGDVRVILQSAAGVDAQLTEGVHYTLTGAGEETGGAITLATAPATGQTLTPLLDPQLLQLADYVSNDPFPAETHERVADRLTQKAIRVRDMVERALRAADGDASVASFLLPGAAARAGKYLRFDASGNPEMATATDGSVIISQSVLGALFYPQTAAEAAAGVTPTYYHHRPHDLRRYGAVGDGSTSDYLAWTRAASVGKRIIVPENFNTAIASASLGSSGIALPDDIVIEGAGEETSAITVTGATACNLFRATNRRGIKLKGLRIRHNGVTGAAIGNVLYFEQTNAASRVGGRVRVLDCRIENCGADNWLGFYNDSLSYDVTDFRIVHCTFDSESGNARGPTTSGVSSSCITFGDSVGASTRRLTGIHVRECVFNGAHIKCATEFWHNTARYKVRGNEFNAFSSAAAFSVEDVGLYVVLIYKGAPGTAIQPDLGDVSGNLFNGMKDCGIYAQSPGRLRIADNDFSGQTGTTDGTLPKGGVAINQGTGAKIKLIGNQYTFCARGLQVVLADGMIVTSRGEDFLDGPDASVSLKITAATGSTTGSAHFSNFNISAPGTTAGTLTYGVLVVAGTGFGPANLSFTDFDIAATLIPMAFTRPGSETPAVGQIRIQSGTLRPLSNTSTFGLQLTNYAAAAQRCLITDLTIVGVGTATGYAMALDNSTGITARDVTIQGITGASQYAVSSAGATGTLEGFRFPGCAAAQRVRSSGGTDLGRSTPTHSGSQGDFVQNLNTADHDTDEMTLIGWRNYNGSTGWRAQYISSVTPAS